MGTKSVEWCLLKNAAASRKAALSFESDGGYMWQRLDEYDWRDSKDKVPSWDAAYRDVYEVRSYKVHQTALGVTHAPKAPIPANLLPELPSVACMRHNCAVFQEAERLQKEEGGFLWKVDDGALYGSEKEPPTWARATEKKYSVRSRPKKEEVAPRVASDAESLGIPFDTETMPFQGAARVLSKEEAAAIRPGYPVDDEKPVPGESAEDVAIAYEDFMGEGVSMGWRPVTPQVEDYEEYTSLDDIDDEPRMAVIDYMGRSVKGVVGLAHAPDCLTVSVGAHIYTPNLALKHARYCHCNAPVGKRKEKQDAE